MKLSKYFLSAFAVVVALAGSIASPHADYAVSLGGSTIIPIAELSSLCDDFNHGPFCQGVTLGGTTIFRLFDDLNPNGSIDLNSQLRSNTQQRVTILVK